MFFNSETLLRTQTPNINQVIIALKRIRIAKSMFLRMSIISSTSFPSVL
jgi:hypothetical protein